MVITTRAQRAALHRIYLRFAPIHNRLTYRQFRKTVAPTFGCNEAVVVQAVGMWLCVERDGYTHS